MTRDEALKILNHPKNVKGSWPLRSCVGVDGTVYKFGSNGDLIWGAQTPGAVGLENAKALVRRFYGDNAPHQRRVIKKFLKEYEAELRKIVQVQS